jgi:hypothetical protein
LKAGVFGEDLQSGPNDEGHEQQVQKVQDTKPSGKPGVHRRLERTDAGVRLDEVLHHRNTAKVLRNSDSDDQDGGSDRYEP